MGTRILNHAGVALIRNLVSWIDKLSLVRDYKPFGIAIVFLSKKEKKFFSLTYDVENDRFSYLDKKLNFTEEKHGDYNEPGRG